MRNTPETNAVIKGKPGDVLSLETRLIEKCADLECQRDELLAALELCDDAKERSKLQAAAVLTGRLDGLVGRTGTEICTLVFTLDLRKINDLQLNSLRRAIKRAKAAHFTDLDIRINGQNERIEADWLKHFVEVTPNAELTGAPKREGEG